MHLKFKIKSQMNIRKNKLVLLFSTCKCDFNITFIYETSDFLINYFARLEIIDRGIECVVKNVIKTSCKYKGIFVRIFFFLQKLLEEVIYLAG